LKFIDDQRRQSAADPRILPSAYHTLTIQDIGYVNGRRVAFWDASSRKVIASVKSVLEEHLRLFLSKLCTHTKGHGGVKGTIRSLQSRIQGFPFVARFDVASYYDSIDHAIMLNQFEKAGLPLDVLSVVRQYLELPDTERSGYGLIAGGSLSPLLGSLYMLSLDKSFEVLSADGRIFYRRYMDDIVILAATRTRLRSAIRLVHRKLNALGLQLHDKQKRFIGRTSKGFDFLGYRLHQNRLLRPSAKSVRHLKEHARRLYERGASMTRLRQYVYRWRQWLWGGLASLVCRKGGWKRYWVWVKIHLNIGQ
jgi:RNA-directed DNA polymerase